MTESITLTIAYDRKIWRRSMSGWWRSVVPATPFVQRAIFWAVVWGAIGILAGAITMIGYTPEYVLAGLVGAGILIAVFGYLQRTRMARFWDVVGRHWDHAGETQAVFSPSGVILVDHVSRKELSWAGIDAVTAVRGATVFRSGISMIAVPDVGLPTGIDGKAFRAQINNWRLG